jgi:hypothetical protein
MKKITLVLAASAAITLAGCQTIIEPESYTEMTMEKSDLLPSKEEMAGEKQKIVVFAPTSTSKLALRSEANESIATSIENILSGVGSELVDRDIARKLQGELTLAENKGKQEYKGPAIADYAITGQISKAGLTKKFTERQEWEDKDGDIHVIDAHCTFKANVSANIKLYQLPALVQKKILPISGSASISTDTRNSNCPISAISAHSLLREAAEKAVNADKVKFKDFFSPKGYVLERRVKEGKNIFKISTGTSDGFEGGSNIHIYNIAQKTNNITGDINYEESKVAEGVLADEPIGANYSWIVVDNQEKADRIKLGDYVKIKYTCSWTDTACLGL